MTNPHGSFIWYELITPDPAAAERFYGDVVDWTALDFHNDAGPEGGLQYRIWSAAGEGIGGLLAAPPGGPAPGWYGYIGVDDVDATAAAIQVAGGAVHMGPFDVAGVGRMAFVADPGGVAFYIMRGASDQSSGAFAPMRTGYCGWHELLAADLAKAHDFYLDVFRWSQTEVMPMGPMGDYQFLDVGSDRLGAMMQAPSPGPAPHWNYYFNVADIEIAAAAIGASGGTVVMGPMEVPGGQRIVQAIDPQGVDFAILGPGKGDAG